MPSLHALLSLLALCVLAPLTTARTRPFLPIISPPILPPSPSSPASSSSPYYSVIINNDAPQRDVNGHVMDIHDGNIFLHNGVYLYYGASYGDCLEPDGPTGCAGPGWNVTCGWFLNHNVSLYTSTDLSHWYPAPAPVFQIARDFPHPAVLFSPKVIYNPTTQLFVLWFNYNLKGQSGLYGTATSASPYGPFVVQVAPVTSLVNAGPSDSALWQDPDTHQGYFIYSGAFVVSVEAMTPDYLSTLGKANSSGPVGAYDVEAPAFFRRGGTYYLSTGHLCCYCQEGSTAVIYTAQHPLGPYTAQANLSAAIPAQQTDITRFIDGQGEEQFMYRGDRWQQSMDGRKSHDPTYFGLIQFVDGVVQPLENLPAFNITVAALNQTMRDEAAARAQ